MISPASLLSRLFAAKGNEIQTAMEDFVENGVIEPIAIKGFAAPFKFLGSKLAENVSIYDLSQDVAVPVLEPGDFYEVMIFSSGNMIERTWSVSGSRYLVQNSKLLTSASPYGFYVVIDRMDHSFSGLTVNYRISN